MRLDKKLHLIAVDEIRKLFEGDLAGCLHRTVRAQKAADHILRHVQGKKVSQCQKSPDPSQLRTCMHNLHMHAQPGKFSIKDAEMQQKQGNMQQKQGNMQILTQHVAERHGEDEDRSLWLHKVV